MSNLLKLTFALCLGVLAAGANWFWAASKAKPPQFVAAKKTIKVGRTVNEDDLRAIPVPGDLAELKKSLIPYKNRAILFGAKASRTYEDGDIFFQRDIQPPREDSSWEKIGPFRIISVGARFKEQHDATQAYASDSSRNNVTIEVDANFDTKTRRLLEVISSDSSEKSKRGKIDAVFVVPDELAAKTPKSNSSAYQTISLEGIPNVPRVLMAGGMIEFVLRAPQQY